MKPLLSLTVAGLFGLGLLSSSGAEEKKKLSERVKDFCANYHTPETIDARLKELTEKEPQNPDPYVLAANAYLKISTQVNIARGDAKGGIADIVDPKTNEKVGTLSEEKNIAYVRKAGSILATAAAKFPQRLDIHVGRLSVAETADDIPAILAAGLDMIKAALAQPDKMRWIDDAPLSAPAKEKVADELQGRIGRLYKRESDEGDSAAYKLATEALRLAPDNMRLLNDAAIYHCYKGEWQKAREFLVRAEKADPKDIYVKHNLAKAAVNLGEPENARRKWEEVIKLAPKSEEADTARAEIAKLPGKTKKK